MGKSGNKDPLPRRFRGYHLIAAGQYKTERSGLETGFGIAVFLSAMAMCKDWTLQEPLLSEGDGGLVAVWLRRQNATSATVRERIAWRPASNQPDPGLITGADGDGVAGSS